MNEEPAITEEEIESQYYVFGPLQDKIITAARVAHQANKAYCESLGDYSQKNWELAPEWQRNSSIKGVLFLLDCKLKGHDITPGILHKNWYNEKVADGWVYGEEKNEEAKTHPCLVPFENLPYDQKKKDTLFMLNIVAILFN